MGHGLRKFLFRMLSPLLPSVQSSPQSDDYVKCGCNLRMIGLAVKMYAGDNDGVFPDRLVQLRRYVCHSPGLFTCPKSGNKPGPFATVDEWTDYVYIPGLTASSAENAVLAYCPAKHHEGEGGNVLFADGHVEWFDSESCNNDGMSFSEVTLPVQEQEDVAHVGVKK